MKNKYLLIAILLLLVTMGLGQTPATSSNPDLTNMKGCVGGSEGNYTLAENGTTQVFRISTSTVDLKSHVGQDVELIGQKSSVVTPAGATDNSVAVTGLTVISEHCATAKAGTTAPDTMSTPAASPTTDTTPATTTRTPTPDPAPTTPASTTPVTETQTTTTTTSTPATTSTMPAATNSAPVTTDATTSADESLPRTASPLAMIGLLGLGLLAMGMLSTGLLNRRQRTI